MFIKFHRQSDLSLQLQFTIGRDEESRIMSLLWEKSRTWRWLVTRTRDSKPFFFAFATVCGVIPGVVGYCVMQLTSSSNPDLEAKLRQSARPESMVIRFRFPSNFSFIVRRQISVFSYLSICHWSWRYYTEMLSERRSMHKCEARWIDCLTGLVYTVLGRLGLRVKGNFAAVLGYL